jgi:hypothetical protein
VREIH